MKAAKKSAINISQEIPPLHHFLSTKMMNSVMDLRPLSGVSRSKPALFLMLFKFGSSSSRMKAQMRRRLSGIFSTPLGQTLELHK